MSSSTAATWFSEAVTLKGDGIEMMAGMCCASFEARWSKVIMCSSSHAPTISAVEGASRI